MEKYPLVIEHSYGSHGRFIDDLATNIVTFNSDRKRLEGSATVGCINITYFCWWETCFFGTICFGDTKSLYKQVDLIPVIYSI